MTTVCFTGHRPNKLAGYNMNVPYYGQFKYVLANLLEDMMTQLQGQFHFISGMALGVDQLACEVVIPYLSSNVSLEGAIPCRNHSSNWPKASQDHYQALLKCCTKVTLVTDAPYSAHLMQVRNQYMVDNSDYVIAIWDGSAGGTENCVRYALNQGKNIIGICPKTLKYFTVEEGKRVFI